MRHFKESDAQDLYKYACDPSVGPIAGWPPHKSCSDSKNIIQTVLCAKEAYAVCLKSDNKVIGAIEFKLNGHTKLTKRDDECELGYWLGKPFWSQGLMSEAVKEMLRHAFKDIGLKKVWCGYYEGNIRSKRVQDKTGFKYYKKIDETEVYLMKEKRTCHITYITKEEWEGNRTYLKINKNKN